MSGQNQLTAEVQATIEQDFESLEQSLLTESTVEDFFAIKCTRQWIQGHDKASVANWRHGAKVADAQGQLLYGLWLCTAGTLFGLDPDRGELFIGKSANQGNVLGQFFLGQLCRKHNPYTIGPDCLGAGKSFDRATEWLRKAERQGFLIPRVLRADRAKEILGAYKDYETECAGHPRNIPDDWEGFNELSHYTSIEADAWEYLAQLHRWQYYIALGISEIDTTSCAHLQYRRFPIEFSRLASLTAELAEYLVQSPQALTFENTTRLDDEVLQILAKLEARLELHQTSLSPAVAASLSKRSGYETLLPALTELEDAKIAHQAGKLNALKKITPEVAQSIFLAAASKHIYLYWEGAFSNLEHMSTELAEVLISPQNSIHCDDDFVSDWMQRPVHLDGLVDMDPAIATIVTERALLTEDELDNFKLWIASAGSDLPMGKFIISLLGLREISDQVAQILSSWKYLTLGVSKLSDDAIESLLQCHSLELPELRELGDSGSAVALAKKIVSSCDYDNLRLDALETLSAAAAKELAKFRKGLFLNGLKDLSQPVAEALSKVRGELSLGGLTVLSEEVAESLAKHKGTLRLESVTHLSEVAAKNLVSHKGVLSLPTWIVDDVQPAQCALLCKLARQKYPYEYKLSVETSGWPEIADDVAEGLGEFKGDLALSGLTALSDAAAASLGKHKGNLWLDGLTTLSDEAAEYLSGHKGDLFFQDQDIVSRMERLRKKKPAKKKPAKKKTNGNR